MQDKLLSLSLEYVNISVEGISMNDDKKKIVQTCLPLELYETLQAHAEEEQRSLSAQIRQILKSYFQQLNEANFRK